MFEFNDTQKQDREQLRLLSIFHYIVAGLVGLLACFPVIHLSVGISMLTWEFGSGPSDMFDWLFVALATFAILFGWVIALGLFLAGRFLARRQHRTFCLVMAGVGCLFTPFGTVLGIFTIIVLMRPAVIALFKPASQGY